MPFLNDRKEKIIRLLFEASNGNIVTMQHKADAARARAEKRRTGSESNKIIEG